MRVIIDRFEDDFAVCEKEDRTMVDIQRNRLPAGAKAGDVLVIEENRVSIDPEAAKERKKHIRQMMNSLWD